MKKITNRRALILLVIGMIVISTSQIVSQFFVLPNFVKGSFIGIGIGLLFISLIFGNFKTVRNENRLGRL